MSCVPLFVLGLAALASDLGPQNRDGQRGGRSDYVELPPAVPVSVVSQGLARRGAVSTRACTAWASPGSSCRSACSGSCCEADGRPFPASRRDAVCSGPRDLRLHRRRQPDDDGCGRRVRGDRQLVEHQSIALPRDVLGNEAHRGRDGRYYSPFGITQSLFNVPFFVAGRVASRVTGLSIGRADAIEKAAVALGNTVAMAAGVWVCYLFARRITGSTRTAARCALATAFATPLWPYSKFGFNAPLSVLFVTIAIYCAWSATRSRGGAA